MSSLGGGLDRDPELKCENNLLLTGNVSSGGSCGRI